ncbi:MAG: hypothetical protein QNJ23_10025 [Woeseiaceae bacterium]|nr:hypothetical protein [Woeseiaceae bacterium]
MILRRITEHVRAQNWFAVVIEFVIVVVGVFVGLQAQDWSTARAEKKAERAAIERLIVEYNSNLELLDADKEQSQKTMAASERLLAMISPEPTAVVADKALAQTILDCLTNPKFVPTLGTTNSLVASGDLRLIGDPEIQRRLTQWPRSAQVLIEWQEIERHHGEELILGLTFDYLAWPTLLSLLDDANPSSALESDYQGLFSNRRFEGLLVNRQYNTLRSLDRIDELAKATQELVRLLEERLSSLEPA